MHLLRFYLFQVNAAVRSDRGLNKMADVLQTTISKEFPWDDHACLYLILYSIWIPLKLAAEGQVNHKSALADNTADK